MEEKASAALGRLTEKQEGDYCLGPGVCPEAALRRLGQYEDMHEALLKELASLQRELETLKAQGKTKTVTYKQNLANRLTLMGLCSRFSVYVGAEHEKD